jgi:hypothetical protein
LERILFVLDKIKVVVTKGALFLYNGIVLLMYICGEICDDLVMMEDLYDLGKCCIGFLFFYIYRRIFYWRILIVNL